MVCSRGCFSKFITMSNQYKHMIMSVSIPSASLIKDGVTVRLFQNIQWQRFTVLSSSICLKRFLAMTASERAANTMLADIEQP